MEEHAKVEEAIDDMLFSLLDASRFARIDLDCDATRGLRVIRGLEGIPHDAALNERIALRRFLEDNLPFLAFPAPEDAAWQEARRVARDRFVDIAGHLTDIWTLPPAAVRTIADWIRIYSENPDYPASLAGADAKPAHRTDPINRDTDGDGVPDGDEALKAHTDPLDPKDAPATPSPAEKTHAESAETAETEPHAESAEGAE